MSPRRRYELRDAELDSLIENLVTKAGQSYGVEASDMVRETVVSAIRLLRDDAATGDLKLINNTLKELRHSFRVFAPFKHLRKVAVFGSARTRPDAVDWKQAHGFAERMADEGWMTITGAGGGIMEAAQGGAGRESSFGVNIRLPFEQRANPIIDRDHKLINFRYFFTRKVTFVKEAHALALFPGGFGTHDEGFEALTLMQTGKTELLPVVFVDSPGDHYWRDWLTYVDTQMRKRGLISDEDLDLFLITDDVDAAVREILNFYSNYHSSRYVRERLVIRLRHAPEPDQLDALNTEFADIVTKGRIDVSTALPEESGEAEIYPRVTLHFNRRDYGRLRLLIDRLNSFVTEQASPPAEASPHEIVPERISPEAEQEEEDAELLS